MNETGSTAVASNGSWTASVASWTRAVCSPSLASSPGSTVASPSCARDDTATAGARPSDVDGAWSRSACPSSAVDAPLTHSCCKPQPRGTLDDDPALEKKLNFRKKLFLYRRKSLTFYL